jgi:hypothetical protein
MVSYRAAGMAVAALLLAGCMQSTVPQICGTPGSPSATMSIGGEQLPPPPQPFEGKIARNAARSTSGREGI